ncbi:MAG: VOC family protein [Candidatus Dormibacterales bacterium]
MTDAKTAVAHKPIWLDLSSGDAAGSRDFYAKLFGWKVEVNPDPLYGGYALATIGGKNVAGIGPKAMAEAPTAWNVYIGTPDAAESVKKTKAAGGNVIVEPMAVGNQGTMVVIQDPSGAFLGLWQPDAMAGADLINVANTFSWAELSARGLDKAKPFYKSVFGWGEKTSDMGEGMQYTEFLLAGESIAGSMEMNPMVPEQVPSYWMPYFEVDDVDNSLAKAKSLGATEMMGATEFNGGRFAIVTDPQGATLGLLKQKS